MGRTIVLITTICPQPEEPRLPAGYTLRPCRPADIADLGRLYFESYEPGVACSDLSEAIDDMEAAFNGAYGQLWHEASLVAVGQDEQIVAAIQVVQSAPWEDTPDCPFIIELFTSPGYRRRGLARALLHASMKVVCEGNHRHLALRAARDNLPAMALYGSVGFAEWVAKSSPPL